MNNEILFLYKTQSQKRTLELCHEAIKSVLRKFRKSVSAKYREVDFSLSCRGKMKEILSNDISLSKGILYYTNANEGESEFFDDFFTAYSHQYVPGRHSIISPFTLGSSDKTDNFIRKTVTTEIKDIEKTVSLALSTAKERNKRIIICTDSKNESEHILYDEIENHLANTREYDITHYDFDELIYTFTKSIPQFDAIVCSQEKASVIKMHINALNRFPLAYSILHTEKCRIYRHEALPYEDFSNLSYASLLIATGNMIEREFGFKSAGLQLKKAVRLAIEKCYSESISEFQKELLRQINTPIRNRQVKTNDSEN